MRHGYIKREYDYAIRICALLAGYREREPVPVSHISEVLYITRPFATKIINQLRLRGITASRQGKFGGVFLNMNPRKLSVFDILEALEFSGSLNECINTPAICPFTGICNIRSFFGEQERLLLKSFKEKKIIDFAFSEIDLKVIKKSVK